MLRRNTELDNKTAEIPMQTMRNVMGFSFRSTTSAVLSADRDNESNHFNSTVAITFTGSPSILCGDYLHMMYAAGAKTNDLAAAAFLRVFFDFFHFLAIACRPVSRSK
jgi:hypothetical protein